MPSHDVLIIGAGLAGQRAALAAAEAGASVAIMSKVHPVRSHSVAAAGGINAAIAIDDGFATKNWIAVGNAPAPLPNRMVTVPEASFAAARSTGPASTTGAMLPEGGCFPVPPAL